MKITGQNNLASQPKAGKNKKLFRLLLQGALLAVMFIAGAAAYRAQIHQPILAYAHHLLNPSAPQPEVDLPAPVEEVAEDLKDEYRMYLDNGLPTLYIDMEFENYEKLLEQRNEALKIGVLNTTDEDFVDAEVQLQGQKKLDAKIRLKGDWTDHLEGDKWSFRVNLKEDGEVLGTRQFSIQTPEARNYLKEWGFHRNLLDENLLTTRYEHVNVLLNGKLLGIYAFEENFTSYLIESQGRRQGVLLRFNEDLMWENITNFRSGGSTNEGKFMVSDLWTADLSTFQSSKIAEDPTLAAEAETARELLRSFQTGTMTAAQVFDVELMGRFFALSDLWSACHGTAWHNLRFYYNPVTTRLEPVAYDNEPFRWCDISNTIVNEFYTNPIFNDPAIRASYAHELRRITQPEYIEALQASLGTEQDQLAEALAVEFPDEVTTTDWTHLKERANSLALELQPAQPVKGAFQTLGVAEGSTEEPTLVVDVANLMIFPVQISALRIGQQTLPLPDGALTLPPILQGSTDPVAYTRVELPLDAAAAEALAALTPLEAEGVVSGTDFAFTTALTGENNPDSLLVGPVPQAPTQTELIAQHPFITIDPARPHAYIVSPGVWDVQGDLTLPDDSDLLVPAGVVLRFEPGAVLYVNGSVVFNGEENAPVMLTAQQDTWGGIVVMNSQRDSVWSYTIVEKTGGIARDGWILTGGITIYKAKIILDHAVIGNNLTEDAINVIHGDFEFRDTQFENTMADAFDSDFSDGVINNCVFRDITGDAVDVSGTVALVKNSRMERIADKGVSVGENSQLSIQNVVMDTVSIGVASKDLSKAIITNTQIHNASFAALAAYIKKTVFGPASIEAPDIVITNSPTLAIAQTGSSILLNGEAVETVDMDVDKLYAEGVLGN